MKTNRKLKNEQKVENETKGKNGDGRANESLKHGDANRRFEAMKMLKEQRYEGKEMAQKNSRAFKSGEVNAEDVKWLHEEDVICYKRCDMLQKMFIFFGGKLEYSSMGT